MISYMGRLPMHSQNPAKYYLEKAESSKILGCMNVYARMKWAYISSLALLSASESNLQSKQSKEQLYPAEDMQCFDGTSQLSLI